MKFLIIAILLLFFLSACSDPSPQWKTLDEPIVGIAASVFESNGGGFAEVEFQTSQFRKFFRGQDRVKAKISNGLEVKGGDIVAVKVEVLTDHKDRVLEAKYTIINVAKSEESLLDKLKQKLD